MHNFNDQLLYIWISIDKRVLPVLATVCCNQRSLRCSDAKWFLKQKTGTVCKSVLNVVRS